MKTSSPHLRISASPHLRISASPHLRTPVFDFIQSLNPSSMRKNPLFFIVLASILVLVSLLPVTQSVHAQPLATCNIGSCFGKVDWQGRVDGAYTQELAVFVTCGSSCHAYDHVSNEMWVIQENTSACQGDSQPGCWLEAGYSTYSTDNPHNCTKPHPVPANCYFFAAERPYLGYEEFPLQNMHTYNGWAEVNINDQVASHSGNCQHDAKGDVWNVVVTTAEGNQYNETIDCNPIYPQHIQTGEELLNSGANSPWIQFEYNQWQGTNGNWNYQGNPGVLVVDSPEYADLNYPPSPQFPGGNLEACSCN